MTRFPGVVIATVRSVDDPEGEGRLLLEFPWMPGSVQSGWAPVAAPMAGPSRGVFFSPEVDDEVLVAFEHGDFDHPFVVGFLWNGTDQPPETDRSNRVIVTPGGHTIRFEDGSRKRVVIQSSGGQTITIDDQQQSIRIQGGGRILALTNGQVQIT